MLVSVKFQMIPAKVTHSVFNQSKPLVNYNLLRSDAGLQRALKAFGGQNAATCAQKLDAYGAGCGSEKIITTAELADRNRPVLHQFDRYGHRIDVAEYHPAYHDLMRRALQEGFAGHGFNNNEAGSQVVRAALVFMENQTEAGHCCPLTMTFSAIPALRKYKEYEGWVRRLSHQDYDPRNVPISEKQSVTVGMSMTEKQGGSDVRLNTTTAKPLGTMTEYGEAYALTGHKWFTSAPNSDGFLTLAKVGDDGSPTCFLVPRWMPDGTRNSGFKVMRLKNKLGDHSNASSEVEYDEAFGTMIGERGKGVKTIIEMVQSTRLDCTIGSAATSRKALHLAIHHTVRTTIYIA
jgi:putative acyl-CoA dehydrogenase